MDTYKVIVISVSGHTSKFTVKDSPEGIEFFKEGLLHFDTIGTLQIQNTYFNPKNILSVEVVKV